MKPVCSIVIRAYNEEQHIQRLLDGIQQQTLKDVQIILVDSGSQDCTVAIAERYPVEIVHIAPKEFTFGRSLNLGIMHAKADLVVFASAHVYPVYPDWLEKLLEPFQDERVAVSYGKQRGMETTQFSEQMIFAHWFPEVSNFNQQHPFSNNANAAIRRRLWEQNAYNETLPGLEDLAWARWAQEQGQRIAYVAEAEIIHVHNESWRGIATRYRREGMAFKTIYPQERFGKRDLIRAFLTNVRTDIVAARKQAVLKFVWKSILGFRWNQFWGTYQGYHQSGPLTWQLKQAFYYPRMTREEQPVQRKVEPIQYQNLSGKGK
ncbi:MAG: family 2 glycosyl transferase [Chloroflexi bacterium HGW-Chloroflexi-10]|nr:MAG: family 2 glycosyl transferase [Chloroflexi bacterium HGW-Chloroflexi-10]